MVDRAALLRRYANIATEHGDPPFGLRYVPSLEPFLSDYADRHFDHTEIKPRGGMFSDNNVVATVMAMAATHPLKAILEIGCWAKNTRSQSSTDCLCGNKPEDCWYVGVDVRDDGRREHIQNHGRRQAFVERDSTDIGYVRDALTKLDILELDILFIDGLHSVKQVAIDWTYAELVRVGGAVILHDINYHAGPRLLFDAVDDRFFSKASVCDADDDFGLGILRRLQ